MLDQGHFSDSKCNETRTRHPVGVEFGSVYPVNFIINRWLPAFYSAPQGADGIPVIPKSYRYWLPAAAGFGILKVNNIHYLFTNIFTSLGIVW